MGLGGLCPSEMSILLDTLVSCITVLDKCHLIPLEKGPMTESVVFYCKHVVLSMLAFTW